MTTYKKYDHYKNSGVEWLGEVPEHWDIKKLRYHIAVDTGFAFPADSFGFEGEPVIRMSNIGNGRVFETNAKKVPAASVPNSAKGYRFDILVGLSGSVGSFGVILNSQWLAVNQRIAILRNNGMRNRLLEMFVESQPFQNQLLDGLPETTILNISMDQIRNIKVPSPPLPEQRAIAHFLDRETAKIDALIEKKSKFIELLEEKRQAFISHAVTKGLDPNAPMKDSGVPWLGEVPAHWEVKKLRYSNQVDSGYAFPAEQFGFEGHPVIRMSNIHEGSILSNTAKKIAKKNIPDGAKGYRFDILVGLSGSVGSYGSIRDTWVAVNQRIAIIRNKSIQNVFLEFFVASRPFQDQLLDGLPETTILNISMDQIRNIFVPHPPRDETPIIEASLVNIDNNHRRLIQAVQNSIALLREKRSALITAAVTGQIDVREEVLG